MTICFVNGIMYKLSIGGNVFDATNCMFVKEKINNCIAKLVKKFFIYKRIKDEYERQNFHIMNVKLIWLISNKDEESNFKSLKSEAN